MVRIRAAEAEKLRFLVLMSQALKILNPTLRLSLSVKTYHTYSPCFSNPPAVCYTGCLLKDMWSRD